MPVGKDIMLQHQQESSHFRLTTLEDIKYLAPRLRREDKQEILAGTGLLPYDALLDGYQNCVIVFTILNPKNKPAKPNLKKLVDPNSPFAVLEKLL